MPNNKSYKFLLMGLMVACIGLISCKNNHIREVNDDIEVVLAETDAYVEQAKLPYKPESTDTVTTKDDIWLGEDSFRISGGDPLPANLDAPDSITLSLNEEVDLIALAEQLRELTGLRFSLDELKASNEIPEDKLKINYSGSLSGLMDFVSHNLSIWWRYRKGEISFYKMETRVFTIYALPVESSMSASLSGTPVSGGEGGDGGSSTTLTMSTDIKLELWSNIEAGIKQVMGEQGEMLVSPTNGTVTVTAAPFTIQKIARYVQDLNEKMSRQVAISVKVLQVVLENSDQYGLNLNAVFAGSQHLGSTFTGPFTDALGNTANGMLTMTLLDGNWKNSNSIIQALSTQGKTSLVTSTSVTTLNNKVAPVQVTTQENYVKETTIEKDNYSGSSSSTSVEMDTDTLNYGFTMEILPRILDNGRLIMLFSMTLTDLISLTSFSSDGTSGGGSSSSSSTVTQSGSGASCTSNSDCTVSGESCVSGQCVASSTSTVSSGTDAETTVVQLPKMQTRGFVQEIAMRSGATLVLTGFETVQNKTDSAGVGQPRLSILGGKEYTTQNRTVLVILMTPEILVSPLSPETRMENF